MPPIVWNFRSDWGCWYCDGTPVGIEFAPVEADRILQARHEDVEAGLEPASLPERLARIPVTACDDATWEPARRWTVRLDGEEVGQLGREAGGAAGWLRLVAPVDASLHPFLRELAAARLAG